MGRTPLHVAAEKANVDCCVVLARLMARTRDPRGDAAPADLSGRTPAAWAALVKDAAKRAELETALFSAGDATVLPRDVVAHHVGEFLARSTPTVA